MELLQQDEFDPQKWKKIIESFNCENFNVLFTDLNQTDDHLYIYSSNTCQLTKIINEQGGIFSIANDNFDSNWFKQERGKELISKLISEDKFNESSLFNVLTDTKSRDPIDDFKNWPIFVKPKQSRGTISSSIILVKNNNEIDFIETTWNEQNQLKCRNKISLSTI